MTDEPTFRGMTVLQGARHVLDQLSADQVAEIKLEKNPFVKLHDILDANTLLPFADEFTSVTDQAWVQFYNQVTDKFNQLVLAGELPTQKKPEIEIVPDDFPERLEQCLTCEKQCPGKTGTRVMKATVQHRRLAPDGSIMSADDQIQLATECLDESLAGIPPDAVRDALVHAGLNCAVLVMKDLEQQLTIQAATYCAVHNRLQGDFCLYGTGTEVKISPAITQATYRLMKAILAAQAQFISDTQNISNQMQIKRP